LSIDGRAFVAGQALMLPAKSNGQNYSNCKSIKAAVALAVIRPPLHASDATEDR